MAIFALTEYAGKSANIQDPRIRTPLQTKVLGDTQYSVGNKTVVTLLSPLLSVASVMTHTLTPVDST